MPDLATLEARLKQIVDRKVEAAEDELAAAAEYGLERLRQHLLDAHTVTGIARQELFGGQPGRYETGYMVNSAETDAGHPLYEGYRTIMSVGWFADSYQAYFREQDLGIGNIPPANALGQAELEAIAEARRRLGKWAAEPAR